MARRIYDNWGKLVQATLEREYLREIARQDSLSSSSSSSPSSSSFQLLDPTLSSSSSSLSYILDPSLGLIPYSLIVEATDYFSDQNLIKQGHSGDIFKARFERFPDPVVVKRITSDESFAMELEFLSRILGHMRFVPLLGYCWDDVTGGEDKFLVYKYMPNKGLSKWLFQFREYSLPSLDWITRSKIAIGVAEGLAYLHHECNPPLIHGDVQASSILLDDEFEVRLGSLSGVCPQESVDIRSRIEFRRISEEGTLNATWAYDVYCFGKVLLELVIGRLVDISSPADPNKKDLLAMYLPYISIYDKELVKNIIDPSLNIDENLVEEVWAMAIVARSCLNPKPNRRPLMRYILKALENPLRVVRAE